MRLVCTVHICIDISLFPQSGRENLHREIDRGASGCIETISVETSYSVGIFVPSDRLRWVKKLGRRRKITRNRCLCRVVRDLSRMIHGGTVSDGAKLACLREK